MLVFISTFYLVKNTFRILLSQRISNSFKIIQKQYIDFFVMMVLDICNCNTGTSTSQIRFVTGFFYKFGSQEIGTDWFFSKV